jgi:hypothetical protein
MTKRSGVDSQPAAVAVTKSEPCLRPAVLNNVAAQPSASGAGEKIMGENRLSRRRFLTTAAKSGAALGVALIAAPAAAKVPQSAVNYQAMPKGKARCDGCANWQPPASCVFVGGAISASGWCSLYRPKR